MAECRGLAPLARRHALGSTQAQLARLVDIPKWLAGPKIESEGWSAWQDLHLQPFRLERNASALGYTRCLRTATSAHGRICAG